MTVKPLAEFYIQPRYKDGYSNYCKECLGGYAKKYSQEHKEQNRIYYQQYRLKYPERCRAYARVAMEKVQKTPQGKLNNHTALVMYSFLNQEKYNAYWKNHFDYTLDELKDHLEKQFIGNMSWSNYGSVWHVDHIIPKSTFTFTSSEDTQFKECWNLNNLRPVWAIVNISKNDKLDTKLVVGTMKKVKENVGS